MNTIKFFILALVLFLNSCGTDFIQNNPKQVQKSCLLKEHFCGFIDNDMVKSVEKFLANKPKKITITSPGGFQDAAIKIARMINNTNTTLEIDGLCLSACAQNFALGVKNVQFTNRSLIAFHHSSSVMYEIAKKFHANDLNYLVHARKFSDMEHKFFNDIGIDINALYIPSHYLEYKCVGTNIVKQRGDLAVYINSKYDWFVPSISTLKSWNVKINTTGLPKDARDFKSRIQLYEKFSNKYSIIYTTASPDFSKNNFLNTVKVCDTF